MDYAEIRRFWEENGPPPHITLQIIAMAHGWDPAKAKGEEIYGSIDPGDGLSIAELATRIRPPGPGGDTLAASREVLRLMATEGRA